MPQISVSIEEISGIATTESNLRKIFIKRLDGEMNVCFVESSQMLNIVAMNKCLASHYSRQADVQPYLARHHSQKLHHQCQVILQANTRKLKREKEE